MPKKSPQPDIIEGQIIDETPAAALVVYGQNLPAAPLSIGEAANEYAAAGVFADYQRRTTRNTLRRQRNDLSLFALFLECANAAASGQTVDSCFDSISDRLKAPEAVEAGERLQNDAAAWSGVTWGLVQAFRDWMLSKGYAVGSVNVRLATVKAYSKLASKAGVITKLEQLQIADVEGYAKKEYAEVDKDREITRVGVKKSQSVSLTDEQVSKLKNQPDTPQGRRDAVLMCLLLDHGLRCGEVALLKVDDFDLSTGILKFFRPKVKKNQRHRLTPDTLKALRAFFDSGDMPPAGCRLLRGSRKGGRLLPNKVDEHGKPLLDKNKQPVISMTERAITARVRELGGQIGIETLSAHDCRHSWATRAANSGTPINKLMTGGGWSSYAMPLHYIEESEIANDGVILEQVR